MTLFCQHPEMIDMELPPRQDTFSSDDKSCTIAYTIRVTDKLAPFQQLLKNPDGTAALSNKQQFEHMIQFWDHIHGHKQFSGTTLILYT